MNMSGLRAIRTAVATGALVTMANIAVAAPANYTIDAEHFSFGFLVRHIGFADILGMFLEMQGSYTFDEETMELSDVRVVVKTESVFTNHEARDEHLRSADFFNSGEFPEMVFVGQGAEKIGDRSGKVVGELTLLGVTQPLTLDVTWNKSGNYPFGDGHFAMGMSARGKLSRSDFGMTYAVQGDIVGDEVELILEFEGIRQ